MCQSARRRQPSIKLQYFILALSIWKVHIYKEETFIYLYITKFKLLNVGTPDFIIIIFFSV